MMSDSSNFFDGNVDYYANMGSNKIDYYLLNFINNTAKNKSLNLLDIGGGTGKFANLVMTKCPNIEVTVVDPSKEMLDRIKDNNIKKIVGMLPSKIQLISSFDYVLVSLVFHHVTGTSIEKSKINLELSLQNIKKFLNEDGFLLIHEIFYESPIFAALSSTLIYYLLKIQNKCGIKFPIKGFLRGLEVYFYNRKEFIAILNDCGYEIVDYYEEKYKWNWNYLCFQKKLILLKDWGSMVFICKKMG